VPNKKLKDVEEAATTKLKKFEVRSTQLHKENEQLAKSEEELREQ